MRTAPVRFRLPLKVKLSLLITGLVVLAVLLVSASLLRKQAQTLTDAVTKRGLTIAANLAGGAKSALVSNDDLTLNILVKEAMRDKDVAYVMRTPEFWNSIDLIGGKSAYELGGTFNDGKGQPGQANAVSHGCPPCRFKDINVINTGVSL